jgi:hypothetical protein
MTDDNIVGIDGRQAAQLRNDQAEREQREEILRQKLKCAISRMAICMTPITYCAPVFHRVAGLCSRKFDDRLHSWRA